MRVAWAETTSEHPDPALRPRVYEASYADVFELCVRAASELASLELAEADPRRGTVSCWVKLAPLANIPLLGPRKRPGLQGHGWFPRLDPRLAKGWLQVRVAEADKGKVRVEAHLRLEVPKADPLAAQLLKNYLRWVDVRRGEPAKP